MDWRNRAACRDEDPELFFPTSEVGPGASQVAQAKTVCARCPDTAKSACLNGAVDEGDDWSVRGGTTAQERRNLTRTRR
jgi:WhiB family redox-sensing transcriptional regulator